MNSDTIYYSQHSRMSDPGEYAGLFDGVGGSLTDIVQAIQNATIHIFWAERYGVKFDEPRQAEVNIRPARKKLARSLELSDIPFGQPRGLEQKLVQNCRDMTLLSVALLRQKGIPARSRCGFGTYFMPNHYEDHWVFEYWDATQKRWIMADSQMDALQREVLHLDFDPLDMPAGKFVTGGEAWRLARGGKANPDDFGIFQWKGMDFIKGNLLRDCLALLKHEVLPWDHWGLVEKEYNALTDSELELLDRAAEWAIAGEREPIEAAAKVTDGFQAPLEWAD
jgi:hypothetical protein